ncbi:MAG: hypothetical protein ACTSWY_16005 [Promethearchaeota archaeon]
MTEENREHKEFQDEEMLINDENTDKDEPEVIGPILRWNNDEGEFEPIKSKADKGIFMILDVEKQQWIYSYTEGVSLISRRTALRKANGIAKTGFVHPISKIRIGVACKLVQTDSEKLPDKLYSPQRAWYEKK